MSTIFDISPWLTLGLLLLGGFLAYELLRYLFRAAKYLDRCIASWLHPKPSGFLHCPNCSYDIRFTPHRCPECGTKLLWGLRPSERDLRRRRPEWIDH